MTIDQKYMARCLQLAANGKGNVNPNPMVGAVVVCRGKIIGEGYHRCCGQAHAEVNAIDSVKDKSLLSQSTLYVSLEPCSHYGKTPPCAELIIKYNIAKVVIGCVDPNPKVSRRGIEMLRKAGIEVVEGILQTEALALNKEFMTAQLEDRPYVCLKWAQTSDGFIDCDRLDSEQPASISNSFTRMLVHKMRAEVSAIMIGTNTALRDNAHLTTRLWFGQNPIRVVLDRTGRIPRDYNIFDNEVETLIFTEVVKEETVSGKVYFIPLLFDADLLKNILRILKQRNVISLLVEGGGKLLQSFIDQSLWDNVSIEIADKEFGGGVKAPKLDIKMVEERVWNGSKQLFFAPY